MTTKLEVGWQFHLQFKTKEENNALFAIEKGPHFSFNTILGLLFVQATGMIIDLVDNVAECQHLNCPPFTIDFRCTSNHVPVMDESSAHAKVHKFDRLIHVIKEIDNLEHFYYAKVLAAGSKVNSKTSLVLFGSKPVPLGPNGQKLHPWGPDS